jgi:threonylcarbamoyladenosine tRNA methylthiotransferase MtaB
MSTPGTFSIHTLGCKLNYAESSTLSRQLERAGWNVAAPDIHADLYVLNTCSVTEFADKKCRQAVRRFKRQNPDAKVIVTGCYAQLKPEELSEIKGVDLVLGAAEKFNLLSYVENLQLGMYGQSGHTVDRGEIKDHHKFHTSYSIGDRTRAFLKVQDGCDYKCSFCTIPRARGGSRSASIDQVIQQAEELVRQGIKEIVLTGVNIGDFGIMPGSTDRTTGFLELIKALDEVEIDRFRISSIEPNLCSDEIIRFVAQSKRFMPHFHMPLQSGSNDMLKRMRRRYRSELYRDRVELIKSLMPHACIGVDVIVGFHGETDVHFQETVDFIHELDISYLHVFTYSERSDTHAEQLDGKVAMETRKMRNQTLRLLSDKKRHYFYSKHVKTCRPVLFEGGLVDDSADEELNGFTDNYIKVTCSVPADFSNSIQPVYMKEIDLNGMMEGRLTANKSFIY